MTGISENIRVLVANEPLAYREVISAAFKMLRPHVRVHATDPTDLDKAFLRLSPRFVVCSRATTLIEHEAPAWVELYPDHTSKAVACLIGEKTAFDAMDFNTLLSILDEAERLYDSA